MNPLSIGCLPLLLLPLACATIGNHPHSDSDCGPECCAADGSKAECGTQAPKTLPANLDAEKREKLLGAVKALEGDWTNEDGEHTQIRVSSGGSIVREIMFPGQPFEMTNVYRLDGNDLCVTHFCAVGNQPQMRATALGDGEIAFAPDGVGDYKGPSDLYMGSLVLDLMDADHFDQVWTSFTDGEVVDTMTIHWTRD